MFENPLNAALLPPILYLIYRLIFPPYPVQKKPLPSTHLEGDYNWMPEAHPPVMCSKKYTVKDLYPFNGRNEKEPNGGKILLAIARLNPDGSVKERTVFDVSNGRNFYGPDGMYGNFAGRDASRGMAKQSFDEDSDASMEAKEGFVQGNLLPTPAPAHVHNLPLQQALTAEMLTDIDKPLDPLTDLTRSEIDNMHGWHDHFSGKYVICGELVE